MSVSIPEKFHEVGIGHGINSSYDSHGIHSQVLTSVSTSAMQ